MLEVSVIIPVFNDFKAIKLTLQALRDQTYPRDNFEIIVIDNGSTDGSVAWLKQQRDIIFLQEKQYMASPYSARNRGIEKSKAEIIALLDSTCVPEKTWIETGLAFIKQNSFDLVGGNVKFDFEGKITAGKIYDSVTNIQMEISIKEKNVAKTANLWVKKKLFYQVGMFVEGIRSGEDIGWTGRCTQLGYKLGYCPNCIAYKFARDTKDLILKQVRVGKGQTVLWKNQKVLPKMLVMSLRNLFPTPPTSMNKLLKKNKTINYNAALIIKIYSVAYLSRLATFYGNIIELTNTREVMRKHGD